MTSLAISQLGGDVLIKGIRHLGSHESVFCLVHVENSNDEETSSSASEEELCKIESAEVSLKRNSGGKTVRFGETSERDSYDCSSPTESFVQNRKQPVERLSNHRVNMKTVESKSSQILAGKQLKNVPLKPSPLLQDSTGREQQVSPKQVKKNGKAHLSDKRYVDNLGLSPRINRKGLSKSPAPSEDSSSTYSQPVKKHSWPITVPQLETDFPPAPLHTEFIGSQEELQKLKFIKSALSESLVPVSPELFRKRAATVGEVSERHVRSADVKNHVTFSSDTNVSSTKTGAAPREVYSKYNSLTSKVQAASKKHSRYGSAH